ncbi:oligopeptide/dipeptide ABC transporter ATP-binding protein [Stappia sp.]|uniref:ABC transporter ATP-binding protein n=1 Tax=Stappia sp. TaxID=1870903 RepID=UPI0032D8FAD4
MSAHDTLVEIRNLSVRFPVRGGLLGPRRAVQAVNDVSLDIPRGRFFGLVGESGSGKTTLGRAILRAAPISGGTIAFHGGDGETLDIATMSRAQEKAFRRKAQLIFQDPYAALSPRMTVRDIIAEPLEIMKLTRSRQETDARVRDIAAKCRLNVEHLRRFPHAFSGGQRQRISIARALVANPQFLVADESVAALDVSIQADILNMLKALQRELGLTFLFISHDLSVVAHTCDTVAVMYLGQIVEVGSRDALFSAPRHPYTHALLSAIPSLDPDDKGKAVKLTGEIPSPANPPSGCRFHTRCPHATALCRSEEPALRRVGSATHRVACHRSEDLYGAFPAPGGTLGSARRHGEAPQAQRVAEHEHAG